MSPLFLFVAVLLVSPSLSDELISVRCQTQCLHHLQHKYQDNSEMRRQMKHHVVNVCRNDGNCSACTDPCRESFIDLPSCKRKFCDELTAETRSACEESCELQQKIYSEKPGSCPVFDVSSTVYECAASCHLDGDCHETSKCCSVGCSRKCLQPETNSSSLLPMPTALSVTERKRRRSAVVRWVMKRMSPSQSASLSNLFVLQWRWGLSDSSLTEWQTILIRNKMYAILKHLLSPGRIYQFRVAAVSTSGSLGFSAPSIPFKLSKEARAPAAPRLSLGSTRLTAGGVWSQTVQWTPPASDLPVKNYEVSWQQSSQSEIDAYEGRVQAALKRDIKEEEEEDSGVDGFTLGGFGGKAMRHSTILASHETATEIENLLPHSIYLVEVHASVDSSEGELHGEKGVIFIRTGGLIPPSERERETDRQLSDKDTQIPHDGSFRVDTPFFDRGKLQAAVSWTGATVCSPRASYVLRLRRESCSDGVNGRGEWEERVLAGCSSTLDGLLFQCRYSVSLHRQGDDNAPSLSRWFSTSDCRSTPSSSPSSACLPQSPLVCDVETFVVLCHWPPSPSTSTESTIGYRVSLSSSSGGSSSISILPPQSPQTSFQNLPAGREYTVEVQPITSRGIGPAMVTVFRSGASASSDNVIDEERVENEFPGGEVIELPLESSTCNILRLSPVLLVVLLCVWLRL